jgi:hypothetical protein
VVEVNWSRRFDNPIKTPDGKTLRTRQDAAEYVLALPPEIQNEQTWQFAAEALRNAAEREIAWMWFARPAMMRALFGPDTPPIGNPEGKKGHRWARRKLDFRSQRSHSPNGYPSVSSPK